MSEKCQQREASQSAVLGAVISGRTRTAILGPRGRWLGTDCVRISRSGTVCNCTAFLVTERGWKLDYNNWYSCTVDMTIVSLIFFVIADLLGGRITSMMHS
jgi:hypothetical protein